MRESGRIAGRILKETCGQVRPGISTLELNNFAEDLMKQASVKPSFKTVRNYGFGTCININEGVVHGLPSKNVIVEEGDLVKIDLGVLREGWHSDVASTVFVSLKNDPNGYNKAVGRFLEAGRTALSRAIDQCRSNHRVSDISRAIEDTIEYKYGFTVVPELTGHGLGLELHEKPDVPGVLVIGADPVLKEGMTLAIEIIYCQGSGEIKITTDGWTIETVDGSLAGLFEHSVAITASGSKILTEWL